MEQEGGLFGGLLLGCSTKPRATIGRGFRLFCLVGYFWVAARSQGRLSAEDSDCFVWWVAFGLQHEAKGDYRPRIPIILFGGLLFAGNRY